MQITQNTNNLTGLQTLSGYLQSSPDFEAGND